MSHNICVIPARMGSSRFPNKPLAPIAGFPMLGHVALRVKLSGVYPRVVVATCDQVIRDFCRECGVESVMTSAKHERASDRVQEAVESIEAKEGLRFDSVTMVQGDEPMVNLEMLQKAEAALLKSGAPVVNLRAAIDDPEEFASPNCVKVVCDYRGYALYFSREPIPSPAKYKGVVKAQKQICVIPFKRDFLDTYSALEPTYLEEVESVDMNRVLEHGYQVYCAPIESQSYPVDVPQDIQRVERALSACPLVPQYNHLWRAEL